MIAINDVKGYKDKKESGQQPVVGALSSAPSGIDLGVPASAVDPGAPVVGNESGKEVEKTAALFIPQSEVALGGPTSPMNEKPVGAAIVDPTDTKLEGGLPDITADTFEEAMSKGKYTPAQWLHENEKAVKEGRREALTMDDYLSVFKYGDMDESPERKAKRERREQIGQAISGIGNVIANAANLAFTAKGAVPIDLNSGVKELDERRQRIKDKRDALKERQDTLLLNAKMGDMRYARDLEGARAKREAEKEEKISQRAFELQKLGLDLSAREARERARRELDAGKMKEQGRHNRAMEGAAWKNAETNRERAEKAGSNKKDKYASSFTGKYGTYRFRDKDVASSVASRAVTMLKDSAQKNGDNETLESVKDAMSELKSAPAALEFLQQRLYKYPDVEKFIAESVDKYDGNVKVPDDRAIKSARDALQNSTAYKKNNAAPPDYSKYRVSSGSKSQKDYSQYKVK